MQPTPSQMRNSRTLSQYCGHARPKYDDRDRGLVRNGQYKKCSLADVSVLILFIIVQITTPDHIFADRTIIDI